jgi:zinc transport system ATP-binding protein
MSSAVEFRSVTFSYDGPNVVEDVTFTIQTGDFVSIVGPNGGGKTTLLKLMFGLLKPKQGSVRLFGKPPRLSCSKVGYAPQFLSVDFDFPLSVLDIVLMGRIRTGRLQSLWYSREDREAARRAIRILQLEPFAEIPFRNLSGGQRQRVLIARAICGQPEILLLDEPTNNIDATSEQILFDTLIRLNQTMTIVIVSHDIGFVTQCVKRVICVNRTVAVHSASDLNGRTIHDLYGQHDMKLVLHDHL